MWLSKPDLFARYYERLTGSELMRYRNIALILYSCMLIPTGSAYAKGLEELSEANPAQQVENTPTVPSSKNSTTPSSTVTPAQPVPVTPKADTETSPATSAKAVAEVHAPSKVGAALSGRLQLATSFGWVSASKSEGDWNASGSADIALLYKLPIKKLSSKMGLWMGYHYNPISVSGKQENHSYRGVWEIHALSTQFNYALSDQIILNSGLDLGYLKSALESTDGLPEESSHNKSAFSAAIDFGCNWLLMEKNALAIGPKISAAFGDHQIYRFSVNTALNF